MSVTLKQINDYVKEVQPSGTFGLDYGDFKVNLKTDLTIDEKHSFVKQVVSNAYINRIKPSKLNIDVMMAVCFLKMCTDVPLPTKEVDGETVIDSQAACDIAKALSLYDADHIHLNRAFGPFEIERYRAGQLFGQLRGYVDAVVEFENQKLVTYLASSNASNEAMEDLACLIRRVSEGADKVNGILEEVGKLTRNGKFLKMIPKNKLDAIFGGLQKVINGAIGTAKGDNVVDFEGYMKGPGGGTE